MSLRADIDPILDRADERLTALSAALDTQTARATTAEAALAAKIEELRAALARVDQLGVEAAGLRDTIRRLEADLADCRAGSAPLRTRHGSCPETTGAASMAALRVQLPGLAVVRSYDSGFPTSWSGTQMAQHTIAGESPAWSVKAPLDTTAARFLSLLRTLPEARFQDGTDELVLMAQHEPDRPSKNITPDAFLRLTDELVEACDTAAGVDGYRVRSATCITGERVRIGEHHRWYHPGVGVWGVDPYPHGDMPNWPDKIHGALIEACCDYGDEIAKPVWIMETGVNRTNLEVGKEQRKFTDDEGVARIDSDAAIWKGRAEAVLYWNDQLDLRDFRLSQLPKCAARWRELMAA